MPNFNLKPIHLVNRAIRATFRDETERIAGREPDRVGDVI